MPIQYGLDSRLYDISFILIINIMLNSNILKYSYINNKLQFIALPFPAIENFSPGSLSAVTFKRMKREFVSSGSLRSVGYDPARRVLEAEFLNGGIYRYLRVPKSVYLALLAAESKGAYFNRRVRDRFVCRKIK